MMQTTWMRLHVFETSILLEYQPQTGQGGPVDASPEGIVWRTQEPGCSIPLIVHDDFLGVLEVASRKENAFSEADAELLTHVADQIAIAVQNALNFENANKARERTQTLLDLNNAITTNLDLHDLVRATSACLRGYFRHDFAGLALYDEDSEQLMIHSLDLSQPEKLVLHNTPSGGPNTEPAKDSAVIRPKVLFKRITRKSSRKLEPH